MRVGGWRGWKKKKRRITGARTWPQGRSTCSPRCGIGCPHDTRRGDGPSDPSPPSVDPPIGADPSIIVVTRMGFSQPSPHRALEQWRDRRIIEQYRAAALKPREEEEKRKERRKEKEKRASDGPYVVELMAAQRSSDNFGSPYITSNKRTDRV